MGEGRHSNNTWGRGDIVIIHGGRGDIVILHGGRGDIVIIHGGGET